MTSLAPNVLHQIGTGLSGVQFNTTGPLIVPGVGGGSWQSGIIHQPLHFLCRSV